MNVLLLFLMLGHIFETFMRYIYPFLPLVYIAVSLIVIFVVFKNTKKWFMQLSYIFIKAI